MADKFLGRARASMERRGTVGSFTAAAKSAGMGVQEFARHELASPTASPKMKKKAGFARAIGTIARRKADPDNDND